MCGRLFGIGFSAGKRTMHRRALLLLETLEYQLVGLMWLARNRPAVRPVETLLLAIRILIVAGSMQVLMTLVQTTRQIPALVQVPATETPRFQLLESETTGIHPSFKGFSSKIRLDPNDPLSIHMRKHGL